MAISHSTSNPLFTIISLCYNHAPFLHDYFRGLLTQTYRNIQLILHDDCSTDDSWAIIKSYEVQLRDAFPHVIIERSERNLGMWGACLFAVNPSRIHGEYLSILETDDYYLPQRIERVVDFFKMNPEIGLVHSGATYYDESEKTATQVLCAKNDVSGWLFEKLLSSNFLTQCTIAHRSSLFMQYVDLASYFRSGYLMADYPITLDLSQHTPIAYIDEILACYRVHRGTASRPESPLKQFEFSKSIYRIQMDFAIKYQLSEAKRFHTEKRYYHHLFLSGYVLGKKETCLQGYKWLSLHDGNSDLLDRIRVLSLNNRFVWKLILAIDTNKMANKLRGILLSLKNFNLKTLMKFAAMCGNK